ncbi:MAG TPA: SulP family inorganic anion transporter [Verrucomicrobiae bacterium]|nr:SulP family inorganic anion transporter [Verrucomicrobiae bacterium]
MNASSVANKTATRQWQSPLFRGLLPFDKTRLWPDVLAGVSLAAMNIPQAMGYTKIAGMPAITGLYTLLLPLVAFAIFGGSRYLVVSADSATAAILAVGIAPLAVAGGSKYVALASLVALLTSGCLLVARLLRLGFLADFLSRTVLVGFLTGVGFQVSIAMLGGMLGIPVHSNHSVEQLRMVMDNLSDVHGATLMVSVGVVTAILVSHRVAPRLPGALFVVIAAIVLSVSLDFAGHGIQVIGPVPAGLPHLAIPTFSWDELRILLPTAGACFVMIIAQSSVTARAYAARHHQPHDENRDLVGLCAADAAAALSGTFVVNGSPTQTAMVETCGGGSQIAHLTTAAMVLLVLLFLTGPLAHLPVAVLASIVFVIGVKLVDVRGLKEIARKKPREFALAVITAATVVLVGVESGIILALILSLLQFVRRSYQPHTAVILRDAHDHWRMEPAASGRMIEPGLLLYWFGAELFYANVGHFTGEVSRLANGSPTPVRWLAVDASAITAMDFTAGKELKELQQNLARRDVTLVLARVNEGLMGDLTRLDLIQVIGPNHIFDSRHDCVQTYLSEARL